MAPRSIVARLTGNLVAGYDTYGFDDKGDFPELRRINKDDLAGSEFRIGGELARNRLMHIDPLSAIAYLAGVDDA